MLCSPALLGIPKDQRTTAKITLAVALVASLGLGCAARVHRTVAPASHFPSPREPVAQMAIDTPGNDTVGLASDGERLWVSDRGTGEVYLFDESHGEWQSLGWDEASGPPGPMTWDGARLWVVAEDIGKIVPIDVQDDSRLEQIGEVSIPKSALHEVPSVTGLAWDGRALWICTGCGLCSTYYRIDPKTGKVLQSFFPSCEPRGLVFWQSHLWTIGYNGQHHRHLLSVRRVGASRTTVFTDLWLYRLVTPGQGTEPTALAIRGGYLLAAKRTGIVAAELGPLVYPRPIEPDGRRDRGLIPH